MKKRVNISIEDWLLCELDKMAEERGLDRSSMISVLIYDSKNIIDLRDEGEDTSNFVNRLGRI